MPDIYFDVDVALSEVPVNVFPLTDDTDFKTRETAVAYNAAGMDLVWNFVTSAGAFTQTAVTPTTAGTYDWTHQGDGMSTIEIPASAGASINNDTEGYGWFSGIATGVLPWRSPIFGFRAAAINDSLCDTNTTGLLAPTVAGRTADIASTGEIGLDFANVNLPAGAIIALGIVEGGTAQSATGTTLVGRAAATNDSIQPGMTLLAYGSTQGYWQSVIIDSVSGDTFTIAAWPLATPSGTITYQIMGTPRSSATLPPTVLLSPGTGTGQVNLSSGAVPVTGDFTATMKTSIGTAVAASAVASVTGNVGGNVVGSVGSVTGGATQASLNATRYAKNTASQKVYFTLVDSTDHVTRKTGITVTAQRSLDGAAFGSATGTVTEVGSGVYYLSTSTADINADDVVFRFAGTACDPVELHVVTY
jgi:hypothetical protein